MTTNYITRFETVLDKLRSLDYRKYRFVISRAESDTVSGALKAANIPRSWYYTNLNELERDELDEIAAELRTVTVVKAKSLLSEAAETAARIIIDFAETPPITAADKKLQFEAAKEILDRAGAIKRTETVVSGAVDHVHGIAVSPQVQAAIDKYWSVEGGDGKPEGIIEGELLPAGPGAGSAGGSLDD